MKALKALSVLALVICGALAIEFVTTWPRPDYEFVSAMLDEQVSQYNGTAPPNIEISQDGLNVIRVRVSAPEDSR